MARIAPAWTRFVQAFIGLDEIDDIINLTLWALAADKEASPTPHVQVHPLKGRVSGRDDVLSALRSQCKALPVGEKIPTHTELMRSLNASERAVREALGVLQREGWIHRKNGVGTFVAEVGGHITHSASPTIIGIARPDASFFDRCIEVMYRRCDEAGLSLLCQPVLHASDGIRIMPSIANEVLGYVVFGYGLVSIARQLQQEGAKVVVIGAPGVDDIPDVPIIYNDHEHGGFLATNHLLELGHERIAFCLQGALSLPTQRRWLGHMRAIEEARRRGQKVQDSVIEVAETAQWEFEPARAHEFLKDLNAPTGIVMWNDYEAAKLLGALTRAGIRVPDDVSLVGYDALPEVSLLSPPLTTIDHSIAYQVRTSVDLLLRPTPLPTTHTVVVVPSLLVRQSTAAPKSN